jgi:DNA primase
MKYNPKVNDEAVHCFGCGVTHDIFAAAAYIESLPDSGSDWIKVTLPALAEKLGVEVVYGDPTVEEQQKLKLFKMASDIATILEDHGGAEEYCKVRGWSNDHLTIASIAPETIKSKLLEQGWSFEDILESNLVEHNNLQFFGSEKVTFVVKDFRGRPVGFVSRNPTGDRRYINSYDSTIYKKGSTLLGIRVALKTAKTNGLYIVEGPGDLAALHKIGVLNAVAICGTAFTADHLALIRLLGIKELHFCLDWDEAGEKGTQQLLQKEIKFAKDIRCFVVPAPGEVTDVSDLLATGATALPDSIPAFEWMIGRLQDQLEPAELCEQMVAVISAEPTAVRREIFAGKLSKMVGISIVSINHDIEFIRDNKQQDRKNQLLGAAERFNLAVDDDPTSIMSCMASLENDIDTIEKKFSKGSIGASYQINKYNALQEAKKEESKRDEASGFQMNYFTNIHRAFSGGVRWNYGVLIYVGGRQNSGKTATVIGIGLDVALSDPDTIVLMHFTDDNFAQVEPRIKTNIALMQFGKELHIAEADNPYVNIKTPEQAAIHADADTSFRNLIENEKLVIIDSEDGNTLGILEKNLRYLRGRHPDKKILVIADNTHNYMDFLTLDQNTRMRRISMMQKAFTNKYRCTMFATAEYRKNASPNKEEMRLPVDDDLADARSLMYLPNGIIHVYNDLNDRGVEHAEIMWHRRMGGEPQARLMLCVTKNKINGWKNKLILDLDNKVVGVRPFDADEARRQSQNLGQGKGTTIDIGKIQ